jgi:hypothetical protein
VTISPRMMVSNSRAPISPAALHSAPLRVMSMKSDSDMWIRWSCAREYRTDMIGQRANAFMAHIMAFRSSRSLVRRYPSSQPTASVSSEGFHPHWPKILSNLRLRDKHIHAL